MLYSPDAPAYFEVLHKGKKLSGRNGEEAQRVSVRALVESSCPSLIKDYKPSWWLPGGHVQTAFCVAGNFHYVDEVIYERTLISLPDGGTLGLDFTPRKQDRELPPDTPIVVILHGLSGGSHESYVRSILSQVCATPAEGGLGYRAVVVNFRGCAGVPLSSPQFYSAGHTDDIRTALSYLQKTYPRAKLTGIGFSLGANVLVRYLGEEGEASRLDAGCALGCPWNLVDNSKNLEGSFFYRNVYSRAMGGNLLKLLSRHLKTLAKLPPSHLTPHIPRVLALRNPTLKQVDAHLTIIAGGHSPPFPFPTPDAYYEWARSDTHVERVRVPLLAVNAADDPIVRTLPVEAAVGSKSVVLAVTPKGGHLGWFEGGSMWRRKKPPPRWIRKPVVEWVQATSEKLVWHREVGDEWELDEETTFWNRHVNSGAFHQDCDAKSKRLESSSHGFESSEHIQLWDSDDDDPSFTCEHGVHKLEAYLYYYGLRGIGKLGPKLIFRTSTDTFSPPSGPSQDIRMMQLLTVHKHAKLDQENLWATIRDKTVKILDDKQIEHTSVDLVRFRWEEQTEDGLKTTTSRVTVWVGVLPDSTSGDDAFHSAQDILKLLKEYGIDDFDIAYRESKAHPFAGPILRAQLNHFHPFKSVIDWLTSSLNLPIAGLSTPYIQGALGFYFKVGEDLYGVTARHVLFPEGNYLYSYKTSPPKRKVVLMGNRAFQDLLESIQALIGTLRSSVAVLEKSVEKHEGRVADGDQQAAGDLAKFQQSLKETRDTIAELKIFFATLKKDWSDVEKRVIGRVIWSPPLTALTPPYGYTRDVCVIKLGKKKFLPSLRGNAADLGTAIEAGKLMRRLNPGDDVPAELDYPKDRMYLLKTILAAANIREPDSKDIKGDPTRFVMKRGPASLTTIGRLNGYESYQRRYSICGNFDSVEAAILPYDNDSGPFSRGGDSGAAIVGAHNDLVAQLTGGAGPIDSPDIIYGTPMEWLWNDVIKAEFPNAVLFFDRPADN